jgi:hypothetical protein
MGINPIGATDFPLLNRWLQHWFLIPLPHHLRQQENTQVFLVNKSYPFLLAFSN